MTGGRFPLLGTRLLNHFRSGIRYPSDIPAAILQSGRLLEPPVSRRSAPFLLPISSRGPGGFRRSVSSSLGASNSQQEGEVETVVYEVNLIFRDAAVQDQFEKWLKDDHAAKVMSCDPGFKDCTIYREETEDASKYHSVVKYTCMGKGTLDNYFENHAAKMRVHFTEAGFTGEDFTAWRRVLRNGHMIQAPQ
mmetsp:Transcript_81545/g.174754  ORF Transcript_81545/g.174754 Transcript_81545/m.174754 type:complete len:192 (-) Transcript_81545:7-582(-)